MDLSLDPSLLNFPPDYSAFDFGALGHPEPFDFGALDDHISLADPTAQKVSALRIGLPHCHHCLRHRLVPGD